MGSGYMQASEARSVLLVVSMRRLRATRSNLKLTSAALTAYQPAWFAAHLLRVCIQRKVQRCLAPCFQRQLSTFTAPYSSLGLACPVLHFCVTVSAVSLSVNSLRAHSFYTAAALEDNFRYESILC